MTEITNALVAKGMDKETARKNAEVLAYVVEGGQLTKGQVAVIEANDVLAEVVRTTLIDANTTWNQRTKAYNETLNDLAQKLESGKQTANTAAAQQAQAQAENTATGDKLTTTEKTAPEGGYEVSAEGETILKESGERVRIKAIASKVGNRITLELESGEIVDADKVNLSEEEALVHKAISEMDISAKEANKLLQGYDGSISAEVYASGIVEAYNYGRQGMAYKSIDSQGYAVAIPVQERIMAYQMGRKALETEKTGSYNNTTSEKERVIDGTGESVHLRRGAQWTDSESPDRSVRGMAETPGGVQKRNEAGRSKSNGADSQAYEGRVNAGDLGIPGGTGARNLTAVSSDYSADTKEAEATAAEQGLEAVFYTGNNLRINHDGKVIEARACIVGKKIYVRADHPHLTATQLTKHELAHDKIDMGEIVTKNVYDMMVAYYGEAKVKDIIQAYAEAYDMGYDTQKAADAVFVEIVCDSEAGINYFTMEEKAGTPHFMENVGIATQADMNSRDSRGPPADGVTHFSRETERFFQHFTGAIKTDEYIWLSNVEAATIKSNIKSRATYLNQDASRGLVWAHSAKKEYAYVFNCNSDYSVTVTDVLDAENDIAIINAMTERMENHGRTVTSIQRNSGINGQQRNGNQRSNTGSRTNAQTGQSQGTKGVVSQPSQGNQQGSVGTGNQNSTNSGADQTRNAQKVKFSREAADKAYLDAVESGDMETAQRLVNETANRAGNAIHAYHGTARADRVGTVFRADRATSGPMAFFTDNREIAENYAKSKKDTSLAYDEEYADYYSQFRVNQNGKSVKVQDLWHSLPFSEKQRLKEAGKHITWDEDMENIVWDDGATHGLGNWDAYTLNLHKGNAIEALIDSWLESGELFGNEGDFILVLELAGIKGVEYRDPDARYEKVYDTFLFIQNPFNTATVNEDFVSGYEKWYSQQPNGKYDHDTNAADMWDKNSQTTEMFLTRLRDDIENRTTYAWTSIPDSMTDYLKYLRHDGIRDTGGKFGGDGHSVWIPFYSEQVKSAEPVVYDDSGKIIPLSERFNLEKKDIRFSREQKQEVNPYGQDGKAEDHASFIRRMHEGSRRVKQIGKTVFAYEPARAIDTSGAVSDAARELRRLGIKYFYHNGLEYNQNGITYVDNGALCTIEQQVVGIYAKAFGDGVEFAGHEAFHVWKQSVEWEAYVETLRRNINISSSVYGIQQADIVLKEYFGSDLDALASNEAKAQFLEELYALVSGKIHSGANENGLKTMFKDYAAVKAAWEELVQSQKGVKFSREFIQAQMTEQEKHLQQVNKALENDNAKLQEDNQYLKQLLKLQKEVTGGTKFTRSSVEAMARQLKTKANASGETKELATILNSFYEFIATSKELTWEDVMEQAEVAAQWLMENKREGFVRDEYAQRVLDDLRGRSFYLDDVQKGEAAHAFGSYRAFRQKVIGTITASDKANMSLDELWKEMAAEHPYYFPEETNSTDMVQGIVDVINTLRTAKAVDAEALFGDSKEMEKRKLLHDVYDSFWRVSTLRTVADSKQKEINRLKSMHYTKMDQVKQAHKEATKQLEAEYRQRMDALRVEYKARTEEKIRKVKDANRKSRQIALENRHKTAMRHKIQKVVKELNDLLLNESKKRHVPDSLKKAVADALDLVNMDTVGAEERAAKYANLIAKEQAKTEPDQDKIDAYTVTMENVLRQGEKMGQRLKELHDAYEEISESDDPDIANAYDPVIAGAIKELSQTIGNTSIRNMTLDQLSDVYDMYRMVLTRVRDANKTLLENIEESISNLASRVVGEVKMTGGEHTHRAVILDPVRKFLWNNLKPVYAMEHMGSDTLTEVFNNVRAGEDTWAKDVVEAREFYLDKSKKYGYNSWDFDKKYHFESASGIKFELTLEQILSLYAYSKREQAHDHIRLGGFVFDSSIETYKEKDNKSGKSILKYFVNTADAHQITPEILGDITGRLTKEQIGFVDDMQEYLSATMGAKGNEVTSKMYGVKLFKEKYYFPLKSAKQFMFEQNEVSGEVKIKNSGFTNKVVAKANNPVILSNFMDVWASHVNDMSMYHAFVLPLEDLNRVFNYNSPKKEGQPPVSVKGTIQSAYSPAAVNYVKQLITDLNGGAVTDPRESTSKALMAKFKKASVFASMSVVVQQPSAVGRAFALIDPKYFIGRRVDAKRHKLLWAELKKYAPVAVIKEMGYFDTNMGRSAKDFIAAQE